MTVVEEIKDIPTPTGPMRVLTVRPSAAGKFPGIVLYSEIFQITGPIHRTATFLSSKGYVVTVPEIYHEFEEPGKALAYDQAGADRGNELKFTKEISAFDSDARVALDYLRSHEFCNGRLGVMGICIGGHLAFRAAMNPDVLAAVCFYATDIHSGTLGKGKQDDSLARASDIKGELLHIWGRQDPHVPLDGRLKVKARLDEVGANYQWIEVNGQHAFLRDEGARYDPALAMQCYAFVFDLLARRLQAGAV